MYEIWFIKFTYVNNFMRKWKLSWIFAFSKKKKPKTNTQQKCKLQIIILINIIEHKWNIYIPTHIIWVIWVMQI